MTLTRRVIFFTLAMCCISCSEKKEKSIVQSVKEFGVSNSDVLKINVEDLKLIPEKGIVLHKGNPFSGTSISKYANSKYAESIEYKDGRRHGVFRKWFENGDISFESHYINGIQSGTTKSWWKNGNLRSELYLIDGKGDGVQWQYYKSGSKFKKLNLVSGREEGLQQSWRENGKIYNNYEVKEGRIFGLKRASLCFSLDNEEVVLNEK